VRRGGAPGGEITDDGKYTCWVIEGKFRRGQKHIKNETMPTGKEGQRKGSQKGGMEPKNWGGQPNRKARFCLRITEKKEDQRKHRVRRIGRE